MIDNQRYENFASYFIEHAKSNGYNQYLKDTQTIEIYTAFLNGKECTWDFIAHTLLDYWYIKEEAILNKETIKRYNITKPTYAYNKDKTTLTKALNTLKKLKELGMNITTQTTEIKEILSNLATSHYTTRITPKPIIEKKYAITFLKNIILNIIPMSKIW